MPHESDTPWDAVAHASFVLLATFRRSGEKVAVPVWIAPDGDQLVVTSEVNTGKVKRLRSNPRVTLTPCGRMGAVQPGAPTVEGTAVVAQDSDELARGNAALKRKYGMQFRIILGVERFIRRVRRQNGTRVILRISRAG